MANSDKVQGMTAGVLAGRTDMLSRAITLVESQLPEDRIDARRLLEACVPHSGNSLRLAISGVPGVGKSTFINVIGQHFLMLGKKIAVLAIDPSSERTKGSILGDKTRMSELTAMKNVFIRPSPTSGALGGVARNTHEAMLLCEAAGFDLIMIETVGVGQSETAVAHLVDLFVLLVLSGAGDELQGIKRGIMEQADLIVVNRSDVSKKAQLLTTIQDLKNALHLFPANEKGHIVDVLSCSSTTKENVASIGDKIIELHNKLSKDGSLEDLRQQRSIKLMRQILQSRFLEVMRERLVQSEVEQLEAKVEASELTPYQAVDRLIERALST